MMSYIWHCIMWPLLATFLFTLIVFLREFRRGRPCKTLGVVLIVFVMVIMTTAILLPDTNAFRQFFYLLLVLLILILFSALLTVSLFDSRFRESRKLGFVLIVLLLVILATVNTIPKNNAITDVYFRVSIVVENKTDEQENVVLYVPLPKVYPDEYEPFRSGSRTVIPTEHGKMLVLSTNASQFWVDTLNTYYPDYTHKKKYTPVDDPDLTTRSGKMVYIYLQSTSSDVSVNLYLEIEYDLWLMTWEYRYLAVGSNPPGFEESYPDAFEELEKERGDFKNQTLRLNSGWNEIALFEGTFTRST